MRRPALCCFILGLALLSSACAGQPPLGARGAHDVPVVASEPRAVVRVRVELAPTTDCEERFDLALYREPGVDLITWDPASRGCAERQATLRYLPGRIARSALLDGARALSRRLEVIEP